MKTAQGAEYLLKSNVITILSMCNIFSLRTKFDRNVYGPNSSYQIVELLHQYHQILFPALNLCIAIVNSIGLDNIEAKSQVSRFVLAHSETILHILTSKIGDAQTLMELKLVTSLLSKIAPFEELNYDMLSSDLSIEYNANLSRIQKELINLISIYFEPEQLKILRKDILSKVDQEDLSVQKRVRLLCVQIAANVCCYYSTMMKGPGLRMSLLIFSPKLRESISNCELKILLI
jgi:nuclear pore complex protein Nup205